MARRKLIITLDEADAAVAERAAEADGLSLSAWLTRALKHDLTIAHGLEGVREYEREYGAFTEEELQWADDYFEGVPGVTLNDPRIRNSCRKRENDPAKATGER